jgi:glycosyltransferase involved in cell wall biosynthesis
VRIAHVIDYFHTDVGYQEFFLAREMARAGHEVLVLTSVHRHHTVTEAGPDDAAGAADLAAAGVKVVRLRARQLGHDRAWLAGMERELRRFSPEVVHAHGPFSPTTVRVAVLARRIGFRLLVDNHIQEFIAPGASSWAGRAFYQAFRVTAGPLLRRRVMTWVAIGPLERRFLAERLALPTERIELVPLGFDPAVFGFDENRRTRLRQAQGWGDELVVAVTGKLHRAKRPDLVARACAELAARRPVRLVLAGALDPDARRAVEQAAGPFMAVAVDVWPMLGRAALADLYCSADVVVFARLPSISIYEAAGTGVRLLVGRDEFSEWLHALDPAVEPVDSERLVDELAPASGRAERAATAAHVFSWGSVTDRFMTLYRSMDGGG